MLFKEIVPEIFPNMKTDRNPQIQESEWTPKRINKDNTVEPLQDLGLGEELLDLKPKAHFIK